jgi:hypothetical protein
VTATGAHSFSSARQHVAESRGRGFRDPVRPALDLKGFRAFAALHRESM